MTDNLVLLGISYSALTHSAALHGADPIRTTEEVLELEGKKEILDECDEDSEEFKTTSEQQKDRFDHMKSHEAAQRVSKQSKQL
ncbi:hypothetical protein SARC_08580 [Sphaeroforma arctica JP610]|uniref:Uncharacterized protein n=1 Tax=Sphaeroforma arctica JP610 TaxID=667725 RepID=A0A0L0FR35_9EUKA|nr:hypothetical protein SARC_08580 [Sphaeroforma arctica JP610]KNC79006.1 hypothetical protein SARC_08580 [Sphaeroforma arctica JP610]|eukprot:XP_014152908.1 hypothetical protein SARC_08580 [Sphaeroforma arctica JP610]